MPILVGSERSYQLPDRRDLFEFIDRPFACSECVGTVLRAFQTGRVQVYATSMVLGLGGLGWFFVQPHAAATVDDKQLKQTGEVVTNAAPGHGYTHRGRARGVRADKPRPERGLLLSHLGAGVPHVGLVE